MILQLKYSQIDAHGGPHFWKHEGEFVACAEAQKLGWPLHDFGLRVEESPFEGGMEVCIFPEDEDKFPVRIGGIQIDDSYLHCRELLVELFELDDDPEFSLSGIWIGVVC